MSGPSSDLVPLLRATEGSKLNQHVAEQAYRPDIMEKELKLHAEIDRRIEKAMIRLARAKEHKKFYGAKSIDVKQNGITKWPTRMHLYRSAPAGNAERIALMAPPAEAIHVAEEGVTEPLEAAQALLGAARALGAELFTPTRVKWLNVEGGRARGVMLEDGEIRSDDVVVAAGAGSVELLASADYRLPLDCPPGLLVHTEPAPKILNGLVMAPELHLRQTRKGSLIAGSDFGGSDPGELAGTNGG